MSIAKDEGEEILYVSGSMWTFNDAAPKKTFHADITFLNSITPSTDAE